MRFGRWCRRFPWRIVRRDSLTIDPVQFKVNVGLYPDVYSEFERKIMLALPRFRPRD